MADALREAYRDLFLITANPKESDREAIKGKFKSYHNVSDNAASNMTATFYALLKLADLSQSEAQPKKDQEEQLPVAKVEHSPSADINLVDPAPKKVSTEFHYNIQVHLPATKDIEVYNAIFKSLKEHLVE